MSVTKNGFVLLPKRWVVERSFAWAARCQRLARDYERLPETLAGLHVVRFIIYTASVAGTAIWAIAPSPSDQTQESRLPFIIR